MSEDGQPVEAPLCELSDDWDANNHDAIEDADRAARPWADHQRVHPRSDRAAAQLRLRPRADHGELPARAQPVDRRSSSIPSSAAPQVVRLTEYSHVLKSPIPARYEDSYVPLTPGVSDQPAMLANVVLMPGRPRRSPSPARDRGTAAWTSRAGATRCTRRRSSLATIRQR